MFLGLMLLLAVGLFVTMNVQANNDLTKNKEVYALANDVNGEPAVDVTSVEYNYKNGYVDSYTVHLSLRTDGTKIHSYRIKVTPKEKITGAVVESVQYWNITTKNDRNGSVTFNCRAPKDGDAAYCAEYDFFAEIVSVE